MWIGTTVLRRGAFGQPSIPFLLPEGRTYSPLPQMGQWRYCLRQPCALRGGCGFCGSLWTMPHFCGIDAIVHAVGGCFVVLHPPTACANLPPAALPQIWVCSSPEHTHFLFAKKKQKREDGENEWRSTIWKRKSSPGAQDEAPLLPQLI